MKTQAEIPLEIENRDLVRRYRPQLQALALIIACLMAHMISFWNSFVLNDHFLIPGFRDIGKNGWKPFWSQFVADNFLTPFSDVLLKATLAIDYYSGFILPAVYHATNVLFHVAAVISVFFLLRRLVKYFDPELSEENNVSLIIPFVACLLFAIHPITSESVAYISARGSIITFLLYTLALHGFLTGLLSPAVVPGLLGYLSCYLTIILSMFASPQAITIPETMIFLGLLVRNRSISIKDWVYERAFEFGAALFVACALPFIFMLPQRLPLGNGLGLPLLSAPLYFATQAKELLTYYLRIFLIPVPLSYVPPFCLASPQANPWLDPLALAGVAVLLFSIYLTYRVRREPFACFGLWLFLIGLIPQSVLVTNEFVNGERFYVSCFGLCLAFATWLVRFISKRTAIRQAKVMVTESHLVACVAAIAVVLLGLTNYRDHSFATDSSILRGALRSNFLDKNVARQSDSNGYVRGLLALMLTMDGGQNIRRGNIEADRALAININLALPYLAKAKSCLARKDYDGANYYAERCIKIAAEQKLTPEVTGLADETALIALTELNQFQDPQKLKAMGRAAVSVNPANAKIYLALAKVYLSEHKAESGVMGLSQVIHARKLDLNDVDMLPTLITAELEVGDSKKFEAAYTAADTLLKITSTEGSKLLVARASLETGRLSKAFNTVSAICEARQNKVDAELAYLLYGIYKQNGQTEDSQKYLAIARQANPKIEREMRLWLTLKPLSTIEQARLEAAEHNEQVVEKRKMDTDVQIKEPSRAGYNHHIDSGRTSMEFITNAPLPALKQPSGR